MEKKLLCIAISLACLPAYAENVFTLGQIEVIGEKRVISAPRVLIKLNYKKTTKIVCLM